MVTIPPSRNRPDSPNRAKHAPPNSLRQPGEPPAPVIWHHLDFREVLQQFGVDPAAGLSDAEAAARLAEHGTNELAGNGVKGPLRILWEQLTALLVVILIAAAAVSALLADYKDAIAIAVIVVLNAILGFTQEHRAEKAMAALKKLAVPCVKVRRNRTVREIPAIRVAPGDIVLLEAGSLVAADCRVIESADLQAQEAALTGESEPNRKSSGALEEAGLPLGDRRNMAYMGTFITAGRGQAVVTETGMRTELGRIARMIQSVEREPTPLQRRLAQLGKRLAAAALLLVAVIFLLGLLRGEGLKLMFLTAVSIGVAAVPEGLPAVVTIALTLGTHRMLRRRVLIRRLTAVETLGSVTIIGSDKTGTLTENRMTAVILQDAEGELDLSVLPLNGENNRYPDLASSGLRLLLAGSALCNDAVMQPGTDPGHSPAPLGDPTEVALLEAAARFGLSKTEMEQILPRIAEAPFASERKRMTTVHRVPADSTVLPPEISAVFEGAPPAYLAFTKGGVEALLQASTTVWAGGEKQALTLEWRNRLTAANEKLASNGMRVLGVAFRPLNSPPAAGEEKNAERELTYVGIIGMIDPPRPEAKAAVAKCKAAGIRAVMITGDHPLTAQYIAGQLGILGSGTILTEAELERISAEEWEHATKSAALYARVSPAHKLKIVESWQQQGHVVAMTGDGVNDAPALKKADIGVAMGLSGTDVAKEAADMVLLDDNFASIVAAVEEGRVIYDNIRKFIRYILATNSGEIWTMLIAPFAGMPLPLLPLQILWMNLVTDGLPALALGAEPAESGTMRRPPHPPEESVFARGLGRHVLWVGLLMAFLSLGTGYWYWHAHDAKWQTMLFTTLTLSQMAHILAIRSERSSLFRIGLFSNKPLLGAITLTVLLQIALIYMPLLQKVFQTIALSALDLIVAVSVCAAVFCAVELEKWLLRKKIPEY